MKLLHNEFLLPTLHRPHTFCLSYLAFNALLERFILSIFSQNELLWWFDLIHGQLVIHMEDAQCSGVKTCLNIGPVCLLGLKKGWKGKKLSKNMFGVCSFLLKNIDQLHHMWPCWRSCHGEIFWRCKTSDTQQPVLKTICGVDTHIEPYWSHTILSGRHTMLFPTHFPIQIVSCDSVLQGLNQDFQVACTNRLWMCNFFAEMEFYL
jgi:hypothetical protein